MPNRSLAILLLLAAATSARAQLTLVPLGNFPSGSDSTAAAADADGSVVVGTALVNGSPRAFRWTGATGLQNLGVLPGGSASTASAVNSDGTVTVGDGIFGAVHAPVRWTPTGAQSLGSLAGATTSQAYAVSGDGAAVIGDSTVDSSLMAFLWTTASGIQDFSPAGTTTVARGISQNGLVIVGADSTTGTALPFRWDSGAGLQIIPPLAGATSSMAIAASAEGSVIIGALTRIGAGGPETRPFRWTPATGTREIVLPSPGAPTGISADGAIVVGTYDAPSGGAWVWRAADPAPGVQNLATILQAGGVNTSGWTLDTAASISADGRTVVGRATAFGVAQAYAATIAPASSTPCEANCDGSAAPPILNIADFTCFLQKFAQGNPAANCDHSTAPPVLNVLDFGCFIQKFAQGCP